MQHDGEQQPEDDREVLRGDELPVSAYAGSPKTPATRLSSEYASVPLCGWKMLASNRSAGLVSSA